MPRQLLSFDELIRAVFAGSMLILRILMPCSQFWRELADARTAMANSVSTVVVSDEFSQYLYDIAVFTRIATLSMMLSCLGQHEAGSVSFCMLLINTRRSY